MADKYVYPYSAAEAHSRNELLLWRESYQLNVACKAAIEDTIRHNFDGMHLNEDCARLVIDEYGFKRVNLVLATTLTEKEWDGRFSSGNKAWSKTVPLLPDQERRSSYEVDSHPAVLDGFVGMVRGAYNDLHLFSAAHCQPNDAEQDYESKVIVLSTDTLKEEYWAPENQLWLCTGGFGSHPGARGRAVYAACLGDGAETRWNRSDFLGVLKEECLPAWAKEKLEQMNAPQEYLLGGQTM